MSRCGVPAGGAPLPGLVNRLVAGLLAVLLAGLIVGWLAVSPALAHGGGGANFTGRAGPYRVAAYDPTTTPDGRVAYRVIVWTPRPRRPVDGATVTVRAHSAGAGAARSVGPVHAESAGNVYRYVLPDPGRAKWEMALTVDAGAGRGHVSYEMHGPLGPTVAAAAGQTDAAATPLWTTPRVLLVAGGSLLVLAGVAYGLRRGTAPRGSR